MILKLYLEQDFGTETTIRKNIQIDSEDANLIKCIESVVGDDCWISFRRYYDNSTLMEYERTFPYIIKDEVIQWDVPFSDVTIRDFRNTHNIDPDEVIYAEAGDYYGGGEEISELISWITSNWASINSGFGTVSSSITIVTFIHKVYKYFANIKNRLPHFDDVQTVVERNDNWDQSALMKLLKVDDAELMDCLLYSIGYNRINNAYIKKPTEEGLDIADDKEDSIWGLQTCGSWTEDITREIHDLNVLLTDLKFRSENLGLHWFRDAEEEVNKCIDKWNTYIGHGENLCFVKLIDPPCSYDRKDIEEDINNLEDKVQELLYSVEELEEQNCDYPLDEQEDNSSDFTEYIEQDEYEEYEEVSATDDGDDDDDIDRYVSPWEVLLTRLLLNSQLAVVITDHGTYIAYVEQVYSDDALLQVLSREGLMLGYQTCNYYDIKTITTDTKELKVIEKEVPKYTLPTLFAHDTSAIECIIYYALEHNLVVKVYISDMSESPIIGKVIEIADEIGPLEDPLIKVQLFDECNESNGVTWAEMSSVEWVSLPVM